MTEDERVCELRYITALILLPSSDQNSVDRIKDNLAIFFLRTAMGKIKMDTNKETNYLSVGCLDFVE